MSDTQDLTIEREDGPGHGRYVIHLPDGLEAEMTFRKFGADKISIDHTYTPPEHRGQNIAAQLMQRAIDDARRDNIKIEPLCSYAIVQFKRHKEWADLLA